MAVTEMERNCVVAERSSLQNVVGRLVNERARVESKREGLAGELDGTRATMADIERERDGLAEEGSLLRGVVPPQYRGGICWRSSISVLILILTLVPTGRGHRIRLASKIPFYLL
jgi:DNA-binding XRE family transcriptional regulator